MYHKIVKSVVIYSPKGGYCREVTVIINSSQKLILTTIN